MTSETSSQRPDALRIAHLSKSFPGQLALRDVSLEVRKGEIHALVGQNGSGKSTLIKVLSGFHSPDDGSEAWLNGEEVTLGKLSEAESRQMRFIHQDLALIPTLTVKENLCFEPGEHGRLTPLSPRRERQTTHGLLEAFDLDIAPEALIADLSPFEQSAVAIARAVGGITDEVSLLVLDEPTASMGAHEVARLFATLRRINGMGVSMLYVSHILQEVMEIADRVTVLRDGSRVAVAEATGMTEAKLVELIVGRTIEQLVPPDSVTEGEDVVVSVSQLTTETLKGVNCAARRGEVLGVTGTVGSGFEDLAECIAGSRSWTAGNVSIEGKEFARLTPTSAASAGVGYVPADRRRFGLIEDFTLAENVTLPIVASRDDRLALRPRAEAREVREWLKKTGVQPADPSKLPSELSGGNQQKVIIAKALLADPKVLVLSNPTQAVDVGAAASIRKLIGDLAGEITVIVASSDAEELEQMAQRVLVTRNGQIACELKGSEITADRIHLESQFEGGVAK